MSLSKTSCTSKTIREINKHYYHCNSYNIVYTFIKIKHREFSKFIYGWPRGYAKQLGNKILRETKHKADYGVDNWL